MPRPEVFRRLHPTLDPSESTALERDEASEDDPFLMSYRSGFWAIVPFVPIREPASAELTAIATLEDGTIERATLGRIELDPGLREAPVTTANGHGPEPLIAVSMTTYEPPLDLFERQVESIRSQTHGNWICVVSDDRSTPARFAGIQRIVGEDPRFVVSRSPMRLGHFHNFERALSMAPPDAVYVTLADQDDRWHPEKLERLEEAIGDAKLVYSDARIVDRHGNVMSDTYWSGRRNNYTNLASLLMANTVTGAASLFRRELLDTALPFPPRHGLPFHDHWLAVVALATGKIAYVDRPLYDYVQHRHAAIGHARANAVQRRARTGPQRLRRLLRHPRAVFGGWRSIYFWDVCRIVQFATILGLRCGERMSARKRRAVRLLAASDRSPLTIAWLFARRARSLAGRNETLGAEGHLLEGIAWRRAVAFLGRRNERPPALLGGNASLPPLSARAAPAPASHAGARTLSEKIRPLELDVRPEAPTRVNLLVPTIDLEHFFGGYIAKLNLARRLADRDIRVRLVTVDPTPPLPRAWQQRIESYSRLGGVFDSLEVAFGREGGPLEVSPSDRFIATTWWTAHLARSAVGTLGGERFLYLIQEYEPFTFEMGARAALASQSYEFPHFALFSTGFLRDYFRLRGLGVFSAGAKSGDPASVAFENAITPVDAPSEAELATRRSRRLLFYARPERHARRNMFELGVLALEHAIADGVFGPDWELYGIGAVAPTDPIELGNGSVVEMLPRRDQESYAELLAAHDVGLALMYTPHPSLVPIEMASAGMLTVTNSFENKTAEAMSAISENLITVEPTLDGLAAGLRDAAAAVDDSRRRASGSQVHWSRDWDGSFDDELMERVASFIEAG